MKLLVAIVLGVLSVTKGQIIQEGPCDTEISVETDFTNFAGHWYEWSRIPNGLQSSGDCSSINFDEDLDLYESYNITSYDIHHVIINNNFYEEYNATATLVDDARFTVKLQNSDEEFDYWFLRVLNSEFALTYSCKNIYPNDGGEPTHSELNFWKLGRRLLDPDSQQYNNINTVFDVIIYETFGINITDIMYKIDHSEIACYVLPILEDGDDVILPGQCEDLPVIKDLDYEAFSGLWHKYGTYDALDEGTCVNNLFKTDSGEISIINSQVINQKLVSRTDSVKVGEGGSFTFTQDLGDGPVSYEVFILDTDYTSYAITYGCEDVDDNQKRIYSQIMTRSRRVDENLVNEIENALNPFIELNSIYYRYTNQSDQGCFYYPEHVEGQPVVFPGQCEMDITNTDNFKMAEFQGIWYVIEHYPNDETPGTCVYYEFDINSNDDQLVDIRSSQVIDERLKESSPKSAKLNNGMYVMDFDSTTLYSAVLDTDYTSYAIVYSCMNLNEDQRGVWSWKISRTKQLPDEANDPINRIVSTIPVIDDRYFESGDQSVDGCFYFPLPSLGQPVVFPGQCDESIPSVENFDIDKYKGEWYEVESYPKHEQPGECIDINFTVNNGNLDFTTKEVDDYYLIEATGTLEFDSSGFANSTATIQLRSHSLQIPYWILGTDYDNYALAYTCININEHFRGIWSWKLSRERTLSESSKAAVDAITENIRVLGNEYYEHTDHSPTACFYLPELGEDEPAVFPGTCDLNIPVMPNFNEEKYSGVWHMISSYTADHQDGTCNDVSYSLHNGVKEIENTQVNDEQRLVVETGTIVQIESDGAKYTVKYDGRNDQEFWILDTDYDSYALIYSCENVDDQNRRVWSWKLSRNRTLSPEADAAMNKVISSINVLNDRFYWPIENSDESCFYYPDIGNNETVSFRGQCDMNIPTVQNFNLQRYLHDWYDVESYPQFFQFGTCPMANYELIDATRIRVTNTQVYEQELNTVTGEARLAGDDGNAKLIVSFPGPDEEVLESNYWVLATDYDNYALVYSCTNTGPDRRSVSTWKLSRSPNLSPESTTAINSVIDSINVLHEEYYVERSHTPEDCFFYPDNDGGPIYLDGQCPHPDDNDMPSFDRNRFADTWYEISRFPSELQTGACSNLKINFDRSEIITTIIYEEHLNEIKGSISDVRNNGYFVADFQGHSMPMFVLATDYDDYALLYSCKNISPDRIQVYSWKLGRKQEGISEEAHTTINGIVREHPDLFHGYYEDTDQSLDSCFYYPVFDNPSHIELLGPCNENITAVDNFDIEAYTDRWFEVSRYPSAHQVGQCARSYFEVNDEAISVLATIVKDEELITVEGNAELSADGRGLLKIGFAVDNDEKNLDYYVLDTDYRNYALVYSCLNLENGNRQVTSWILSRNPNLDNQYLEAIKPIIKSTQGLRDEYYISSDQGDAACFYVPEVDLDRPVIFRGQCEDIKGVSNLNVDEYLGWWHEIESYPTGSSKANCVSYQYEANGGQYNFIQTSVSGQSGDVRTGTLEFGDDGRLRKTYSNGDVIDMWVLATDYETYSLLYSCENIDDEYRQVWSAKLSKARSLTQSAQDALQRVIDETPILYNKFYSTIDQSNEACFYYPEQNGPLIVIPGQCDANIPVVRDFRLNDYLNTWYLIEDYPHPQHTGYCSGAIYNIQGDQGEFRARNFQVINDDLEMIEGSGIIASNDGTARMRVTFPEPDTNSSTTTDIFILATDYESYSLVYTCENINEFQRYIGAWKLSRSRRLSSEATSAINAVILQRQELHQPYFSSVRQDDDCPSSGHLTKHYLFLILLCLRIIF